MDEFEDALRRYRPAGPPAELRGRVVATRRLSLREWFLPAAAAAAALLLYALTDSTHRRVMAATSPDNTEREAAIAEMAADLGGDETARLEAERLVRAIESADTEAHAQGTVGIEESMP